MADAKTPSRQDLKEAGQKRFAQYKSRRQKPAEANSADIERRKSEGQAQATVAKLRQENVELAKLVTGHLHHVTRLESEMERLQGENGVMSKELARLTPLVETLTKERDALAANFAGLQEKYRRQSIQLEESLQKQALRQSINAGANKDDILSNLFASDPGPPPDVPQPANEESYASSSSRASSSTEIDRMQSKIQVYRREVDQLRNERRDLTRETAAAKKRAAEVLEEQEMLKATLQGTIATLVDDRNAVLGQLAQAQQAGDEAIAALAHVRREYDLLLTYTENERRRAPGSPAVLPPDAANDGEPASGGVGQETQAPAPGQTVAQQQPQQPPRTDSPAVPPHAGHMPELARELSEGSMTGRGSPALERSDRGERSEREKELGHMVDQLRNEKAVLERVVEGQQRTIADLQTAKARLLSAPHRFASESAVEAGSDYGGALTELTERYEATVLQYDSLAAQNTDLLEKCSASTRRVAEVVAERDAAVASAQDLESMKNALIVRLERVSSQFKEADAERKELMLALEHQMQTVQALERDNTEFAAGINALRDHGPSAASVARSTGPSGETSGDAGPPPDVHHHGHSHSAHTAPIGHPYTPSRAPALPALPPSRSLPPGPAHRPPREPMPAPEKRPQSFFFSMMSYFIPELGPDDADGAFDSVENGG